MHLVCTNNFLTNARLSLRVEKIILDKRTVSGSTALDIAKKHGGENQQEIVDLLTPEK